MDEPRGELLDLLVELPVAATRLGARLNARTAASLADLVRVMNCFYSNLIEGHNTRPRDIVRVWGDEFDTDAGVVFLRFPVEKRDVLFPRLFAGA